VATIHADKIQVDRSATPPEEPHTKLVAAMQALLDSGATYIALIQDVTDSCWVVVYST
jgi:hypothetical protein